MLRDFAQLVPSEFMMDSGLIFYSGWSAFSKQAQAYIVGANPGGVRGDGEDEHIGTHLDQILKNEDGTWSSYSSYLDGRWRKEPGREAMQQRIAHLFDGLGLNLRETPSSNLVFLRSTTLKAIEGNLQELALKCWPFHQAVIEKLRPKIILCLGGMSGGFVRNRLNANLKIDSFTENNRRRWTSEAHAAPNGTIVATLTHPARADWKSKEADPTALVKRLLLKA